MAVGDPSKPKRWAILIGVDFYSRGNARQDPDVDYQNLKGCVRDIIAFEDYLLNFMSMEKSCIIKLTATTPDDSELNEPDEPDEDRPTYQNIKRVIESITKKASPGDLVYIHYSGHGARAKTIMPEFKGQRGYDEVLVPTDICIGGRYLRDIEIAGLLSNMVKSKLIVTVTLDCCHAGSGNRGSESTCRGTRKVDSTVLPSDKLSDLPYDILQLPTLSDSPDLREIIGMHSLSETQGYEFFAACRQGEKACESLYPDDAGEWHGKFTYWLLETLKSSRGKMTHGMLHQVVRDKINIHHGSPGEKQTPIFAGNESRHFFDNESARHIPTFSVLKVEGDLVYLDVGKAHTACDQTECAIYPKDTEDYTRSNPLAYVTLIKTSDLGSTATFIKEGGSSPQWREVIPGCRAILSARPFEEYTRILTPHKTTYKAHQIEALNKLRLVDVDKFSAISPLHLKDTNIDDGNTHNKRVYTATVNDDGKYKLWTGMGTSVKPIPNLIPCSNPEKFLGRVSQLAHHQIVKDLKNLNEASSLYAKFSFRVKGRPSINHCCRYSILTMADHPTEKRNETTIQVKDDSEITIVFENRSKVALNLTIFDLQPLWGVTQIYPKDMNCDDVDPGDERELRLKLSIPPGIGSKVAIDTIKAFVTVDPTCFRALQIPDIDINSDDETSIQALETRTIDIHSNNENTARGGGLDLQSLLKRLTKTRRDATVTYAPEAVWGTGEITVHIGDKEDWDIQKKATSTMAHYLLRLWLYAQKRTSVLSSSMQVIILFSLIMVFISLSLQTWVSSCGNR